ncbi:hypothetical protein ACPCHT_10605 [Nucisporomicrobium flavum]|uniref:hypothetical protein n=1 Tax=Nucisporomicrobium flavum TaxID=2785915 RepID=UPI003C2BB4C9
MNEAPRPPAWIDWPVRVLAVIFVLPFRLLWELLGVIGRFLARWVGRPLAWLGHHLIVVPVSFLWHYLVAVPGRWLWRWLVVVPVNWLGRWLWQRRWIVVRPLAFLVRYLLVIPVGWLLAVVTPVLVVIGNGIAAVARGFARLVLVPGWRGAGWVLWQVYRWLLRPVGLAVRWVWRHTVVPVYRTVAAAGRWVQDAVLRPAAEMGRAVLVSVGLRR